MTAVDLYTPPYQQALQALHAARSWGNAGASHLDKIMPFIAELKAMNVLDYGCGRASLGKKLRDMGHDCRDYDPGIPGLDALPEPADLVVATDVLEHVEPGCLVSVLAHIKKLALRGVFLVIATDSSKVSLLDGRNSHLIQRDPYWWLKQLRDAGLNPSRHQRLKGINVWVKSSRDLRA